MKQGSVERIKRMLTPEVTIQSAYDIEDGIEAEVKHAYYFPEREGSSPIPWSTLIRVKADRDGNVYSTEGLF